MPSQPKQDQQTRNHRPRCGPLLVRRRAARAVCPQGLAPVLRSSTAPGRARTIIVRCPQTDVMDVNDAQQLVVATGDAAVLERVLAVTATLGLDPEVVADQRT